MRLTYSPDFELVWAAYPWKSKKGDAFKAWKALRPDVDLVRAVLEALAWQVKQPRWTKDGGAYIPLMGTWLRANCWEDEPFTPPFDPSPQRGDTLGLANAKAAARYVEMTRPERALPERPRLLTERED